MLNESGSGEPRSARKLAPRGKPAAPRRQSLLRSQARSALLPAASPRVRAAAVRRGVHVVQPAGLKLCHWSARVVACRPPPGRDIGYADHVRSQAAAPAARAAITRAALTGEQR